jgi:hypothetical protein
LADIGFYTAYLAGVELEHSHDVLADLLGMVADNLCPPLRLAKLEGDAVFCVAREGRPIEGETLLGVSNRPTLRSRVAVARWHCPPAALAMPAAGRPIST